MAGTPADYEKTFVETAKERTGRTVEEWLPVIKKTGLAKQKELTDWLKNEHKLNHMQATFLAGMYLNGGKVVYQNEDNLMAAQFEKCAEMKPLFEAISEKILSTYPDTQLIAKKTYLSFTAKKEFAAINVKPKEIRLGFDLGDMPFTDTVQKSKLTGPMPRISHMVVLTTSKQIDKQLMELLKNSYDRTHKK